MAWEIPLFEIGTLTAAADLSAKQYYCVKVTGNNQINVCSVDGEVVLGVLQDEPASGEAANVRCLGVTKVVAGETLTAGDLWGTDASGKAKVVDRTLTGADVGDYVAGIVLEGAAANELATVTIGFPTTIVQ